MLAQKLSKIRCTHTPPTTTTTLGTYRSPDTVRKSVHTFPLLWLESLKRELHMVGVSLQRVREGSLGDFIWLQKHHIYRLGATFQLYQQDFPW